MPFKLKRMTLQEKRIKLPRNSFMSFSNLSEFPPLPSVLQHNAGIDSPSFSFAEDSWKNFSCAGARSCRNPLLIDTPGIRNSDGWLRHTVCGAHSSSFSFRFMELALETLAMSFNELFGVVSELRIFVAFESFTLTKSISFTFHNNYNAAKPWQEKLFLSRLLLCSTQCNIDDPWKS